MKKHNYNFTIIYILIILIPLIHTEVTIEFERKFPLLTKENIMNNLIENNIYTTLTLGTPEQKIPVLIKINEHESYIAGTESTGNYSKFNEKNSITFKTDQKETKYFSDFVYAYKSKDTFNINSKKYEDFDFYLGTKETFSNPLSYSGILGLGKKVNCYDKNQSNVLESFIEQLQRRKIIKNQVYYIKYLNENKGQIIIGDYPHEINKKNYNEINLRTSKGVYDFDCDGYWDFYFDNVTYNNKKINEFPQFHVKFQLEQGVIEVGNYFYNIVNNYFIQNKCVEKIIEGYSNYYSFNCEGNVDISKFPNLTFYQKVLDMEFTLTYKDLFYFFDNRHYFLIIINCNPKSSTYWIMGTPFFKKYLSVFDVSFTKEKIGFYLKEGNNENKENIVVHEEYKHYKISFFISVAIIIGLIILLYYIFIRWPRKKRANELLDDFEYISGTKFT